MKLKPILLFLLPIVFMLVPLGCSRDADTPTPYPRYTSYPTYTPLLPPAIPTPVPTPIPSPLVPMGIKMAFPTLPPLPRMVHLTHANDGTNRLWVVLQSGRILVFPNDRSASATNVFLDIQSKVSTQGNEEGLLGLAFDPDYANNGYFYVYYSADSPRRSVISRFSVSDSNSNRADSQSQLVLLEISQPYSNHNGGHLLFGNDDYLYIGLGDGGSSRDPHGNGQNRTTILGSILRIDVSKATHQEPYQVPMDNPFVGTGEKVREEIWAYGLRNPWRFSFDPTTGDLWAGDVGQVNYEEVDIIKPGQNYGWNVTEGFHCYPPRIQSCDQTDLELPVIEYTHAEGCSITGGHVYRGTRFPDLVGAYVYADFCSGRIWSLRHDGTTITDHVLLTDTRLRIPAFGIDEKGELYILSFDGHIYRFASEIPVRNGADLQGDHQETPPRQSVP